MSPSKTQREKVMHTYQRDQEPQIMFASSQLDDYFDKNNNWDVQPLLHKKQTRKTNARGVGVDGTRLSNFQEEDEEQRSASAGKGNPDFKMTVRAPTEKKESEETLYQNVVDRSGDDKRNERRLNRQ